ncbi:hypothetical protein CWI42_041720 [Ordospora colligata]|uniref:Uncharacterized protein n=1 Tax=Ordospora colligata OC4 TaxID=1354746 RepID=A0A0B2ULV5_9MICR|nr:uncharacterized protein M896_041730 [Ordospora colligata OC4]KHN69975.1 hypothetical protein M896_041730 [Ordospora colligata OC4]TBU16145.1 hypothetical protein CWI41_041720 [Ordospora colligata]TBU16358.1 hypothetical protein CWI40_041720 [Ordospora colligata]TBU19062.1 hypothetical protein CWI42_041720 [Ordospora colligata]
MDLKSGSDGKVDFKDLDALFEILQNERCFKIQIITLESYDVFEEALADRHVKYVRQFSSNLKPCSLPVLILADSDDYDIPENGRYILLSNKRHREFVQIVLRPTIEEKLAVVGYKYVVYAHKLKSITALRRITCKKQLAYEDFFSRGLNYFESIIMLVVKRKSRFVDILNGVNEIDASLCNGFVLKMKLNDLIKKMYVTRKGDSYKVNVSDEVLRCMWRRAGLSEFV